MKEMIKWNPIFIGLVIAIMPVFLVGTISANISPVFSLSFLFAGLAAGFLAGRSKKVGLLNGAIVGLVGGIIFFILQFTLFMGVFLGPYYMVLGSIGAIVGNFVLQLALVLIGTTISLIVITIIGGLVGSLMRDGLFGEKDIGLLDMFESYNYNIVTALGYIFGLLGGVIGLIAAIYLLTRKDKIAKTHGIIILGIFVLWILLGIQIAIQMFLGLNSSTNILS